MPVEHFADRLCASIDLRQSRVIVGLDPVFDRLPPTLRERAAAGPEGELAAIDAFCRGLIESTAHVACAFKPQVAFFERYGSRGIALLERLLADYAEHIFICDCKRSDIGNTSEAYARAYFSLPGEPRAPLDCAAVTHNPYLGRDSIEPYLPYLRADRGMFLLARTSNPSSADFQELLVNDVPLAERVAEQVAVWADDLVGARGYSSLGLVVGATFPESAAVLRRLATRCIFLVPGLETQGGELTDAHFFANADGTGAVYNFSRAVMHAWERGPVADRFGPQDFDKAAAAAAEHYRDKLNEGLDL